MAARQRGTKDWVGTFAEFFMTRKRLSHLARHVYGSRHTVFVSLQEQLRGKSLLFSAFVTTVTGRSECGHCYCGLAGADSVG
jgi:hypothetical protein